MPTNYGTAQKLATFENALKVNYLPVWNSQLGIEPTPLLSKIKKIPLTSKKIETSAPVGLSGGFGYGDDGGATPKAGNVPMEKFTIAAKSLFTNIEISVGAVKLTGSGGAMANALDTEVKGGYATAKWNVGRSLFGNGTGVLTTFSNMGSASTTVTVADTKFLKEGLIVDFYNKGGTSPQTNGAGRRIVSVNRASKTITIDAEYQFSSTDNGGFITIQNSFNKEMTGLGAIYDDTVTSLYGITKDTNPLIKPVVYDADHDITNSAITKVLRAAQNDKNSEIDTIFCGDDAYDAYADYLGVSNIRVEDKQHVLKGGFNAIKFAFGNRTVDIVNESFVPKGEMWGVDSKVLELHQTDWDFAELQGGGIFNLMEGSSVYRALLCNFGDLICKNPGGCVRIYNCV